MGDAVEGGALDQSGDMLQVRGGTRLATGRAMVVERPAVAQNRREDLGRPQL